MALVEGKLSVDFAYPDMDDYRFDYLTNAYGDKIEGLLNSELLLAKTRIKESLKRWHVSEVFTVQAKVE